MTLRPRNLTFDSADPESLARFWGEALNFTVDVRSNDAFAVPPGWNLSGAVGPRLLFQRVAEPKTVKNRLHLDLTADYMNAEVQRLVALGARMVRLVQEEDLSWTVMADPEGNEFCVLQSPD